MKTLFLDAQVPETAETAANIIKNGGLIGGASLVPEKFVKIIEAANQPTV